MNQNYYDQLNKQLLELRPFLDRHSDEEIKNAIANEDFSSLMHLPVSAIESMANCGDFRTDIWWYVEIRNELKLEDFPCVHIAYAISTVANQMIESAHNIFSIKMNDQGESITIGYCPWCTKPLNTSILGCSEE